MDNKRFLSIRFKLLNPLTIIFGIFIVIIYFGADRLLTDMVAGIFQEEIVNVLEIAEECVDGDDIVALRPAALNGDEVSLSDTRYDNVLACFDEIGYHNPRAILTTYYIGEQGSIIVGVDSLISYTDDAYQFGETLEVDSEFSELMEMGYEELTFEPSYYEDDQSGVVFAGFMPLLDSSGQTAGGLMVDMAAGETIEAIAYLRYFLLFGGVVSFVIIAAAIFFLTNQVTASLRKLTAVAEHIGEGDYEEVEIGSNLMFADEVGTLADRFNEMARQVYKREKKLVEQVTRMKIFIDQDRRKEELDDILESDFFKKLHEQKKQLNKSKLAQKDEDEA